jgi:hypothetical protein
MHTRRVEVAIGFADKTWRELRVEVPQNPDYVLDDAEAEEKAQKIAMTIANDADWNVAFIHVIFVEPLDDMDGLI